jgi:hypothetical protein
MSKKRLWLCTRADWIGVNEEDSHHRRSARGDRLTTVYTTHTGELSEEEEGGGFRL